MLALKPPIGKLFQTWCTLLTLKGQFHEFLLHGVSDIADSNILTFDADISAEIAAIFENTSACQSGAQMG